MKDKTLNLLVTINKRYLNPLVVMLYSYIKNNSYKTNVYIMNTDLDGEDINYIYSRLNNKLIKVIDIKVNDQELSNAPVSKRFPITMYYRLFAYLYLPNDLERVLYLDPDLIVNQNILELYNLELNDNYYAGASHVKGMVKLFNDLRLGMKKDNPYINSGVLLINLSELRRSKITERDIYQYIHSNKYKLCLPDQDVLSKIYAGKIKLIDEKIYNATEKMIGTYSEAWMINNSKIIHYCGKNKPWNECYQGVLNKVYQKYASEVLTKNICS